MHDTTITIRVNADLKRRAAKAAEGYGTSLSQAIRLFLDAFAEQSEPRDTFYHPRRRPPKRAHTIVHHPVLGEEGDVDIIDPVVRD